MSKGVLVHEWLAPRGGSENVFEELVKLFPTAARVALWDDSAGRFGTVDETWLARTPLRKSKALALPLMPVAWRGLPAVDADWVLISSHVFAHHARFRGRAGDAPQFIYTHTPARYVWEPQLDGRGNSLAAKSVSALLKPIDRRRAQENDHIAANSRFVAARIERAWQRESTVIYPPVDVDTFMVRPDLSGDEQALLDSLPDQFLLGVSRFVPYKQLLTAVDAGRASGLPVVLAGSGPDEQRLRAYADEKHPGKVTFVISPSHTLLRGLYRRASALVFAPIEDFGIVPVEAMASGTPVVANAVGGAAESVVHGETGALLHGRSQSDLREAVSLALASDPSACVDRARDFDINTFRRSIVAWMNAHGVDGTV